MDRVVIARRQMFSSAHFYRQEQFSDEENRRVFGLCYTKHGHGHNYVVEAFIDGPIDPKTKLVVNLADLDQILKDVTRPLEHHHLNHDVPEFAQCVPTTENIALYLAERIGNAVRAHENGNLKLQRLRLYETDDIWAEVWL